MQKVAGNIALQGLSEEYKVVGCLHWWRNDASVAGPETQRLRHLHQNIAAYEFCGLKSLDIEEAILLSLVPQYTLQW